MMELRTPEASWIRCRDSDVDDHDANFRFEAIKSAFLARLHHSGQTTRNYLYNTPKPGEARIPTEEELVRRVAGCLHIPLDWIVAAIDSAFAVAAETGGTVVSFRYVMPHIMRAHALILEAVKPPPL